MITLILQNGCLKRDKIGYISQINHTVKSTKVENFAEASKVIREYITCNGLGSSTFTGGEMYDNNIYIGRVSYNGRVWDPENNEINLN